MFSIDKNITELDIKEKNILKLLFSMNVHQVATPEMILEDAKSYILFFRESTGMVSAYIALYLTVTNRRLYYVYSSNPFPEGQMDSIEEEALEFAEGLGAMLDEKDFSKMTTEEKESWIDTQEMFNPKAVPKPSLQPAPAEQTAAAPAPAPQTPPPAPPVQETSQAAAAPVPQTAPPQQESPVQQVPVQQVPSVQPASIPQTEEVDESEVPSQLPERHAQKPQRQKDPPAQRGAGLSADAARKRQEILQKAIKEGIAKPPKQSPPVAPAPSPSTGVVSRDREALARLLTSF
jgi:hypothetical protein